MQGPQGLNQQFIDRNSAKKKRQTAGTEKAEGVKQLMTLQFYGVIFNMAGFAVFTWRLKATPK